MRLTDLRAHDGSRQFLALPESISWERLRTYLGALPGAEITGYLTDHVTEVWIDFRYRGHRFSVNNPCGEYWFFVQDPDCPPAVLEIVAQHCAVLLRGDEPLGEQ